MTTKYYKFNIDDFPPFYGTITLPRNTIIYRGFCTDYSTISDRPSYYSFGRHIAEGYAQSTNCRLGIFRLKKNITLYDLRYIKHILMDLFTQYKTDTHIAREACKKLALSFGICSFKRQIELLKEAYSCDCKKKDCVICPRYQSMINFYKELKTSKVVSGIDLVEPRGFRVAETRNDILSNALLKEMFENYIDGYVANKMFSPYHIEKTNKNHNSEILLFNCEKNDLIEEIKESDIDDVEFLDWGIWKSAFNEVHFRMQGFRDPMLMMKGGNENLEYTRVFNRIHPNILIDTDNNLMKEAEEFSKKAVNDLAHSASLVPFRPKPRVFWDYESNMSLWG